LLQQDLDVRESQFFLDLVAVEWDGPFSPGLFGRKAN
jgi:hypothetical protein